MSALSLRLPDSVHRHIKELAQQEGGASISLLPVRLPKRSLL